MVAIDDARGLIAFGRLLLAARAAGVGDLLVCIFRWTILVVTIATTIFSQIPEPLITQTAPRRCRDQRD